MRLQGDARWIPRGTLGAALLVLVSGIAGSSADAPRPVGGGQAAETSAAGRGAGETPSGSQAAPPERLSTRDFREILAPTPVTRAVDLGVEYLTRSQLPDGSWLSSYFGKNTGIVGLAGMAILSAGHEPGRGRYGECVDRAVRFILAEEQEGFLAPSEEKNRSHGPMYEHGIATLFLGEVLGMLDEERPGFEKLQRVHRQAVDIILRAQAVPRGHLSAGGWRYRPWSTDADISVTGWQLLALRAAQDTGLAVPRRSIELAVLYIKRCQHPSGGFGYMPGPGYDPGIARTGTGILSLEICGDYQSEEARRGGDWLLKTPLEWKGPFFFYSAYYAAQAMYQLGGDHWAAWRPRSEEILLRQQTTDGSWPSPPGETHEREAGPVYTTSLAILSLTVDYKYLPIYQR